MNNPLRWLVLALFLFAASCMPKGSAPDGVYYVEDYHHFPEYRPVEPERFVYGVRVTPQISAMLMWGPEFLWLFVINPTESEAVLEWDNSSLLVDGQAEPLLLVQEGFDCRRPETSPRQTVVPPNSHFQGYLLPASHIAWRQFAPEINYDFEARRVVATEALKRCENQEGFNRFVAEMRETGDWRQVIKGMTLGECGYEYPTQNGETNE